MEAKNLSVYQNFIVANSLYWMEFEGSFTPPALPGQFMHVKIDNLFLRRPFSIAKCKNNRIGILYKVIGEGTEILSRKKKGDSLSVIGPLGNGYPLNADWKNICLAGGGTGIAPLLFLSDRLSGKDVNITFLCGAKSRKDIAFRVLPCGIESLFSTEDGSYGRRGLLDGILKDFIRKSGKLDVIYGGGPAGLLKKIAALSDAMDIPAFVSLENRMACGTGICYGCVTKIWVGDGWEYKRICREGPVFDTREIRWE